MFSLFHGSAAFGLMLVAVISVNCQIDEICREIGILPSLDSPFAQVPYVYGRIKINGGDSGKSVKTTVIFWDREQNETRWTVGNSGNYCFKRNNPSGGLLVVEVNGSEVARKALPSFGPNQQREDFEVSAPELGKKSAPGTLSAKFSRPTNVKTIGLYRKVAEAEQNKQFDIVLPALNEIVELDPEDFVAWAKLGTVYFERGDLPKGDAAFRRALQLRVDYTPAWLNVGKLRMAQKQYDAAAEIFKHASTLDPSSARIFQLMGEAYVYAKKGSLGAEALNKAIELDPAGMADQHLLLATLYDRAGAKGLAAREYKLFLEKVKDHPEKKKFESYIKENSVK